MADNPAFVPEGGSPRLPPGDVARGKILPKIEVEYYQVKSTPTSSPSLPQNSYMAGTIDQPAKGDQSFSSPATSEGDLDPWALPELQDTGKKWSELGREEKLHRVCINVLKFIALIVLLYLFICSLDFLASGFKLVGGKAAGEVFQKNEALRNPVVGLMIGVLVTVLVQSSSTSTSIVVTMVASSILDVPTAIPIVMGANIGTSVTNTLVSLAQSGDRNEFRRAFGGATVHDMFNWLSVIVLLPLEIATGYLYKLTKVIVDSIEWSTQKGANKQLLTVLTKPFTSLVIQLDSKVITAAALGDEKAINKSLIKEWCKFSTRTEFQNVTLNGTTEFQAVNVTTGTERCKFLFNYFRIADSLAGFILLVLSLVLLCGCLILMVKILHSVLRGQIAQLIKKTINADFPKPFGCLTGYLAILVGCIMTILVQSSSIFTSALTPLVGIGVISIERMYPLTLGSNIGTTTTGLLAALTAVGEQLKYSIQIALCHLFFNISGILIFYPIPFMRWPIGLAQTLGNTTAKYRWFSVLYLIVSFFIFPGAVFLISLGGTIAMLAVGIPFFILLVFIVVVNLMQRKMPQHLPNVLKNWDFLPLWCHSLDPLDRLIVRVQNKCGICCKCCPTSSSGDLGNLYNAQNYNSRNPIIDGGSTFTSMQSLDMKTKPEKTTKKRPVNVSAV